MVSWNLYGSLLTVKGDTRRDRMIYEAQRSESKRLPRSPSYKTVLIDNEEQNVIITSATELWTKKIQSMPNEYIYAGSIVLWNNKHWLIEQVDCEDEIYQKGLLRQCNCVLKWQNTKGDIISRFGYATDLTQFAAGEVENKVLNSIQLTFKVELSLDEETVVLRRGKRFLIDVFTDEPNAYILTNRNVVSMNFNPKEVNEEYVFDGKGSVLQLTITQTQLSRVDNVELMIADYFDEENDDESIVTSSVCNISYSGKPELRIGNPSFKIFNAEFFDSDGNVVNNITPTWTVTAAFNEFERYIVSEQSDNSISLKILDNDIMFGAIIQLEVEGNDGNNNYNAMLNLEARNLYG